MGGRGDCPLQLRRQASAAALQNALQTSPSNAPDPPSPPSPRPPRPSPPSPAGYSTNGATGSTQITACAYVAAGFYVPSAPTPGAAVPCPVDTYYPVPRPLLNATAAGACLSW